MTTASYLAEFEPHTNEEIEEIIKFMPVKTCKMMQFQLRSSKEFCHLSQHHSQL